MIARMKNTWFALPLLAVACTATPEEKFSLTGTVSTIPDGTVIYMQDPLLEKVIDSTVVQDSAFTFHTTLAETPRRVILRAKDLREYRYLWAEEHPMILDASQSNLREAQISGSETEDQSQALDAILDTISGYMDMVKAEAQFIEENPSNIMSASSLAVYATVLGKDRTQELYDQLSEELKQHTYGQRVARYLELVVEPQVGDPFVDFEMADTTQVAQKLSDHLGQVTLLEFWAAWCGPCREENPNLVKTYEAYHSQGFEVFAVSLDGDMKSWRQAIEKDGLPWTHVSDLSPVDNMASLIYGVNGIPDNFLIDKDGNIVARGLRGEDLDAKVAELLGTSG